MESRIELIIHAEQCHIFVNYSVFELLSDAYLNVLLGRLSPKVERPGSLLLLVELSKSYVFSINEPVVAIGHEAEI